MAGNINYIDYDVLTNGKSVYAKKAEEIATIVKDLKMMNSQLCAGWKNETARGFVERMEEDHFPKLLKASESIQEVSNFINSYMQNKQSEDQQGKAAISG